SRGGHSETGGLRRVAWRRLVNPACPPPRRSRPSRGGGARTTPVDPRLGRPATLPVGAASYARPAAASAPDMMNPRCERGVPMRRLARRPTRRAAPPPDRADDTRGRMTMHGPALTDGGPWRLGCVCCHVLQGPQRDCGYLNVRGPTHSPKVAGSKSAPTTTCRRTALLTSAALSLGPWKSASSCALTMLASVSIMGGVMASRNLLRSAPSSAF